MSHPFFDSSAFPWDRPDARALHTALSNAVAGADRIDLLYRSSGPQLPPLPLQASADVIWKEALERLTTAGRLQAFCELVLKDVALAAIHDRVRAVVGVEVNPPTGSKKTRAAAAKKEATVNKEDAKLAMMSAPLPLAVLREAIEKVRSVRYALGVIGITAAAAIGRQFFATPGEAIAGTLVVFVMMVLLLLFSSLARVNSKLVAPSLFLTWAMLFVIVVTLVLVVTSVFFRFPMPYPELVGQFKGVEYGSVTVKTVDNNAQPVRGARVSAQGATYQGERTSDAEGAARFEGIPSTNTELSITATATGFQPSNGTVTTAPGTPPLQIVLTPVPPPPAAPAAATPGPPPAKTGGGGRQPFTAELKGTWEIVVSGDITNVRARKGTFQFSPQPDGEIIVSANFTADNDNVRLTGVGSIAGNRLYIKFSADPADPGSLSRTANFTRGVLNHLSGRLQLKKGDEVAVELRKLAP